MPSSPERAPVWELADLAADAPRAVVAVPRVAFSAAASAEKALPPAVFEVAPTAGVPDDLVAEARRAAQAAGYAAGWASGIQAARVVADAEAQTARAENERLAAERRARLQQAFVALDHAAGVLEERAVPAAEQIEDLVISSALAIVEELVGQVLRDDAARSHAALTRALALAPVDEPLTVRVSPADHAALAGDDGAKPVLPATTRSITLVADAALAPGDAVATCGATEIDARLSAGLARVREALRR